MNISTKRCKIIAGYC